MTRLPKTKRSPSLALRRRRLAKGKLKLFHKSVLVPTFVSSGEPKKTLKKVNKVAADSSEEGDEPEDGDERPRVYFDFPRYSDQLRTSLIPMGGSVDLKWHIQPEPKRNKKIDIVLEKRDVYTTLFPIASNLSVMVTNFTWEVGVEREGRKNPIPLHIGDYRLWIFESGRKYSDIGAEIIPASTAVTLFAPIDVSAKFNINSGAAPLSLWGIGGGVVFFLASSLLL